ncbi:MAG: SusD/RagB family nutrient-binding outer membrane lipoprotein, partial [Bacteroidota bacterium]|nr:SusD/RagB family nutrient-binding outer membrane lipoprotein [Bacteroidota bacterium]
MKKPLLYIILLATIVAGCTKNFDSINTDPTRASASTFDPNLLLPTAELGYISAVTGYSGPLLFQSMWVQIFANAEFPTYYSNGDKYFQSGNINTYDASTWNNAYGAASQAREMQNLAKGKDALTNLSCIADILEIASVQVVTDTYGDCPYSQALAAKSNATYLPVYDKQQDIYNTMLTRLDSILPLMDVSKANPTNDASSYKGDVAKWKKFGYSLMLKIAMRLTKVDAATAQKYAEKAAAGGTMASVDDNLYLVYDNTSGYANPNSGALVVAEDYTQVKWGKILIDMLKATNDPRLSVIAEVPAAGLLNQKNESLPGNSDPAVQMGMPNG